jgi:myo-inositol 2-dehydrogenase/D-chiro-inositol 1-dehydrogenase
MPGESPSAAVHPSRRDALRVGGLAGTSAAMLRAGMRAVHAQEATPEVIRVGLVGAGGRGTGALQQTLSVPGSNVKVTAIADAFQSRIERALKAVEQMEDKVECPADRQFTGLDAAQKLIDLPDIDLVILATPPGFRPYHFEQAIKAGKHVFMEKPVCIDSFGARLCLEAAKLADEKNRKVVVGLQRHYDQKYRETIQRIRDGLVGDIIGGQVYWNGAGIWYRGREPDQNEMQFQVNNWYHFNWLCGDHICEQHVHNIDVANWVLDALPQSAYGVGGRQNRVPGQSSEIYDHHAVNFSYPNGVRIASQCRQFPGGAGRVDEEFQGTKGYVKIGEITNRAGKVLWKFEGKAANPYQVEHDELHDAIRNDKPLNNAYYGTTSSFSAVLGRLATYSGKPWKYADALALDYRTMPEDVAWDTTPPVLPDAEGNYPLPMPATFKITSTTTPPVS